MKKRIFQNVETKLRMVKKIRIFRKLLSFVQVLHTLQKHCWYRQDLSIEIHMQSSVWGTFAESDYVLSCSLLFYFIRQQRCVGRQAMTRSPPFVCCSFYKKSNNAIVNIFTHRFCSALTLAFLVFVPVFSMLASAFFIFLPAFCAYLWIFITSRANAQGVQWLLQSVSQLCCLSLVQSI